MSESSLNKRIEKAAFWIQHADHLVVFTGAGISTNSGIPDYRGPDGVWTRRDQGLPPPRIKKPFDQIEPNRGHFALTRLQELGYLKFLISQNVDNLHRKSGIDSNILAELHGNRTLMRCLKCNHIFSKPEIWDEEKWGTGYRTSAVISGQPTCSFCGGRIISSIVNFGDPLPRKTLELAIKHAQKADVFLVVGSSLQVSPANHMPRMAKENGGHLIIINQMETPLDALADILFREDASQILEAILDHLPTNKNP